MFQSVKGRGRFVLSLLVIGACASVPEAGSEETETTLTPTSQPTTTTGQVTTTARSTRIGCRDEERAVFADINEVDSLLAEAAVLRPVEALPGLREELLSMAERAQGADSVLVEVARDTTDDTLLELAGEAGFYYATAKKAIDEALDWIVSDPQRAKSRLLEAHVSQLSNTLWEDLAEWIRMNCP